MLLIPWVSRAGIRLQSTAAEKYHQFRNDLRERIRNNIRAPKIPSPILVVKTITISRNGVWWVFTRENNI
jgi:hypothetical protein